MSAVKFSEYKETAVDETKRGGDLGRAQVFATLALAEAISDAGGDVANVLERMINPIITIEKAGPRL